MADVYDRIKRLAKLRETPNRASLVQITDIMTGVAAPGASTGADPATPPSETPPPPTPTGGGGTLTFIAQAADDQTVGIQGAGFPPSGSITRNTNSTFCFARKRRISTGFYEISVPLLKWDTSAIPDAATIVSVTLRVLVTQVKNDNARSVTADWTAWDGTDSDYSATAGTSANSGIALSSVSSGGVFEMPLSTTGVSKSGTTYLKIHISDGATPVYDNRLEFTSADGSGPDAPKLIVTYA